MASEMLENDYIGTVLKLDKEKRLIGVYIPKLMPALYDGSAIENKFPTNNGIDYPYTNINISSTVKKINYIWVKPFFKNAALPKIGSKVNIRFLDGSISLGQCWAFDVNGDYDVIDDEKYKKILSFQISDKASDINEEDMININLPNDYTVARSTNDKNITYTIEENFDFYKKGSVSKVITDLQKSMEYFSDNEYKTFTDTISQISSPVDPSNLSNKLINFDNDIIESLDIEEIYNIVKPYIYTFDISTIDTEFNIANNKFKNAESDNEKNQIKRDIIEFVNNYLYTPDHYIDQDFNSIKEVLISKIINTDNLLDAARQYSYTKILLNGLYDIYKEYYGYEEDDAAYWHNGYIELFNANKTVAEAHGLKKQILDSNIRLAFSKAITSTNDNTVQNYISYLKNMFDTTPSIIYQYYQKISERLDSDKQYYVKKYEICSSSDYDDDAFYSDRTYYEPIYIKTNDTAAINGKNYYTVTITFEEETGLNNFEADKTYYIQKSFVCTDTAIQRPLPNVVYYTSLGDNIYEKFTGSDFTQGTVYYIFNETKDDVPIINKSYFICNKTYTSAQNIDSGEYYEAVYVKTSDSDKINDKDYYKPVDPEEYVPYGNNDYYNNNVEYFINVSGNYIPELSENYVIEKTQTEKHYAVFNTIDNVYLPDSIVPKPLTSNVIAESYKFTNFVEEFEKKDSVTNKPVVIDNNYFVTKTIIAHPEFYRMWVDFDDVNNHAEFNYSLPSIASDDVSFSIDTGSDTFTGDSNVVTNKLNELKNENISLTEIERVSTNYEYVLTSDTEPRQNKNYYFVNQSDIYELFSNTEFDQGTDYYELVVSSDNIAVANKTYYDSNGIQQAFVTPKFYIVDYVSGNTADHIYYNPDSDFQEYFGNDIDSSYYERENLYNPTSDVTYDASKTYYIDVDGDKVKLNNVIYYDKINEEYILSTDNTRIYGKIYYTNNGGEYEEYTGEVLESGIDYYEHVAENYIPTTDTSKQPNVTYYKYDSDAGKYIVTEDQFQYYELAATAICQTSDIERDSSKQYYTKVSNTYEIYPYITKIVDAVYYKKLKTEITENNMDLIHIDESREVVITLIDDNVEILSLVVKI